MDPPLPVSTKVPGLDAVNIACSSKATLGSTMSNILVVYSAFLLAMTASFAFLTRNVRAEYNESKQMASIVSNSVMAAFLIFPTQ